MYDQVAGAHKWAPRIITANIVFAIVITTCLGLRLRTKAITKAKYGWDDYMVILAQIIWYAQMPAQTLASRAGLKTTTFADQEFLAFVYWLYIAGAFYFPLALYCALSILFFYRRIFPLPNIQRRIDVFIVIFPLWGLSATTVQIFTCWPINIPWTNPMDVSNCVNYPLFYVTALILEIVLNAAILVLPMKEIIGLTLHLETRLSPAATFLISGVSIISNTVRTIEVYIPGDIFVNVSSDMFWIQVHTGTAFVCANLLVCKPLMKASVAFVSTKVSRVVGSYGSYDPGYNSKKSTDLNDHAWFPNQTSQHHFMDQHAKSGGRSDRINVETTMDIV